MEAVVVAEVQVVEEAEREEPMEDGAAAAAMAVAGITDLPDEILENIFARVSPYDDLDSLRAVCQRFYFVSKSESTNFLKLGV